MKIRFVFNSNGESCLADSSSTISSSLVENYFLRIYADEIRSNSKSTPPRNLLGLQQMFLVAQLIRPAISFAEFFSACRNKLKRRTDDEFLTQYNSYLTRCGLTDLLDLWNEFPVDRLTLTNEQIHDELDRVFLEHFFDVSIERPSNGEEFRQLFDKERLPIEPTTSKNYIRQTFCMYFSLLLDTRNEHALVHCLITPARQGLERRTIVELRRLSQLKKNEALTMYQILLSFLRRKDLSLTRTDSTPNDETFLILDKYYLGIKEFFDFLEQLQTQIEENEHSKVDFAVTFRQLLTMICKQLRKDHSFHRCDALIKEVIEEFSLAFETTSQLNNCSSPKRSASSGGTLAGRRFLRALAFLCAKKLIELPILVAKSEHYESPSTGLKKATAVRLLRSPLTPIAKIVEPIEEKVEEKKPAEIPVESVFVWQKKTFPRRKSQRCLDLATIDETSGDFLATESSNTRQSLGELSSNSLEKESRSSPPVLPSVDEEENRLVKKKRSIDSPKKIVKKSKTKALPSGQKSIKNFFK